VIAVDTSVWIDHLRNRPTPEVSRLRRLIDVGQPVGVTGVVRLELLRGVSSAGHAALLGALDEYPVITTTSADFDAAASLFRAARDAGSTVRSSIDCLIAAPCIRLDIPLLHSDADFDKLAAISDLRVVTP
jgi:predicted nucleic acid-binding protein